MKASMLPDFSNTEIAFKARSSLELMRARVLFQTMNAPQIVKWGSSLLKLGFRLGIPLAPMVKWTVFQQFCGGVSLEDCRPLLDKLGSDKVKAILDYGAEGEKTEAGFEAATREFLRTADEAGRNIHIPFVVFKCTGIARFELLEKISKSAMAGLTKPELAEWARVERRIDSICDAAITNKKPVMIDAEESWIQGAIDALCEKQMARRNRDRAWVFMTVQLYRHDRLAYLKKTIQKASAEGWHLGVKLVRGAYMEKERAHAEDAGLPSPIQPDKAATDRAYDEAVNLCFNNLSHVAFCAGTHNEHSAGLAAKQALALHAEKGADRVWFSQLYGMSDHLTYNLAAAGLNAAKYIPYGPVEAVVPYLIRRAEENTSVAGQSSRELQLIESEMKRRGLF